MTPEPQKDPESLWSWLRRELWREAKFGAVLLVSGAAIVLLAGTVWTGFENYWNRFNYQLARTALNQHPLALARTFASRLNDSEYGWRVLSWSTPFNVTAAHDELRSEFPEIVGVYDGKPVVPRERSLKRANPAEFNRRIGDFMSRYYTIEANRFTWLYGEEDVFSVPDQTTILGQMATKSLGIPDAILHTIGRVISAGLSSILMFSTVLAVAGVAIWRSKRPARPWLKLLLWPLFASVLVWIAVFAMAISAAVFGKFTPNTSALTLVAVLPILLLFAKLPLRMADSLLLRIKPGDSPATIIKTLTRAPFPAD